MFPLKNLARKGLSWVLDGYPILHTTTGLQQNPDSKVHGANMGPIWGRQDPGGPHVGPTNFAIWAIVLIVKDGLILVFYDFNLHHLRVGRKYLMFAQTIQHINMIKC